MITWSPGAERFVKMVDDVPVYYEEGVGKSTDNKPTTGIANSSSILEMDTGKVFFFDEETGTWGELK